MCRIGSGEPRFETRFELRSSHIRLLPRTSSGEDEPIQIGVRRLDHALPSITSERNTVPSAHIR